jgi:hypothetical protein
VGETGAYVYLGWVAGCIFCSHSELHWIWTLRVSERSCLIAVARVILNSDFVPCLTPVSLPLYNVFRG